MALQISTESLSTAEKLEAIELLWASLLANEEAVPSPAWHQAVIQQRLERHAQAQAPEVLHTWSEAREALLDAL
jgi:hypothetical protein